MLNTDRRPVSTVRRSASPRQTKESSSRRAFARTAPVLGVTAEDWTATLSTNLLAPYRLCAGLIPAMMDGRGGSVINVISGAAFRPRGTSLAYGASKAALWSMTQYLAQFCAPKVRVNGLVPGLNWFQTTRDIMISRAPM